MHPSYLSKLLYKFYFPVVQLHEPAYIAEILTVRQVSILWIHTVANLEAAGILQFMLSLEGIERTLLLHYLKRINRIDMLLTISIGIDGYQFNTDSIIQSLLIHYVSDGILLTAFHSSLLQILALFAAYNLDAIPLLSNLLLPRSQFLSLGIVVGREHLEALSLLVVELLKVVIQLTLHRVMRSNLSD